MVRLLVWIYEVIGRGGIERRFSFDMTVDCTYWFDVNHTSDVSLRVHAMPVRVSDALEWREGCRHKEQDDGLSDRKKMTIRARSDDEQSSDGADRDPGSSEAGWRTITRFDWQRGQFRQLKDVGREARGSQARWRTDLDKPAVSLEDLAGCDTELLQGLLRRLDGRRLLYTEYRRLCQDIGLLRDETELVDCRVLQILFLKGLIELTSGMSVESSQVRWLKRLVGLGRMTRRGVDVREREVQLGRSVRHAEGRRMPEYSGGSIWEREVRLGRKHRPDRKQLRCGRCNSGWDKHHESYCEVCGRQCVYCEQCLQMGRVRECSFFIIGRLVETMLYAEYDALRVSSEKDALLNKWGLSPAQAAAARDALAYIQRPAEREGEQYLIWAVTGAGKTEMVFPLVEYVLRIGGRVLLTAPRRDVVLELAPRLARAFADRRVVTLFGGSEERWETGEITVATTHQLLRLERCFDLVILDELDAFPYHNNPMLAHAARRACKLRGKTVLLTATPPREQQLAMRQRRLPHAMVPVRYHRHPLPVPRLLRYRGLKAALGSGSLPSALRAALDESLQRGAQVFVFVPRIEHVEPLTRLLRKACAGAVDAAAVDGTSSRDDDRASRVRRFRSGEIRILVTTTILERGVTIPRSDVFVLDADADLFDEAALVQMAGRAGRSADDPCGRVYFVARERTDGQMRAVRHIRAMNALARKRGLLTESEHGSSSPWSGWFRPDVPGMLDKLARAMAGAIEAFRSRPVAARRRPTEPGAGKEDAHAPMDPPAR